MPDRALTGTFAMIDEPEVRRRMTPFSSEDLSGSVLDGLAEWPASNTRKEWLAITRQLIRQTIADMDLDPDALRPEVDAFAPRSVLHLFDGANGLWMDAQPFAELDSADPVRAA